MSAVLTRCRQAIDIDPTGKTRPIEERLMGTDPVGSVNENHDLAPQHIIDREPDVGEYGNVIEGEWTEDGQGCTGGTVSVDDDGTATVSVAPMQALAIHGGAKPN